jgi:hypothetical protein
VSLKAVANFRHKVCFLEIVLQTLSISWKTSARIREGRISLGCCVNPELFQYYFSILGIRIELSSSSDSISISWSSISSVDKDGG